MGNWRRQSGEIRRHQELNATRNSSLDTWHSEVPSWEKKFCYSVGLPWRKLLETKKCMYLYDNVVKWNDSAGEEAFHNAKSRFWAKINGLPCNISLPDPDIYIDEIDWSCNVDPDLLLDLERELNAPVAREGDEVIASLYEALGLYRSYTCIGWGEPKEDFQKPKADHGNCDQKVDDGENSWEINYAHQNNGAWTEEYLNNSVGWNDSGNNNHYNHNHHQHHNHNESDNRFMNGIWRTWDANCKNMGGNWYHSSMFEGSRLHCDGYQKEHGWRKRRGGRKRVNFAHEPHHNAPESWNHLGFRSHPSGPVSHHWSGNGMHGVRRNQFCEY